MRSRPGRTSIAALLVGVGVIVPCAAWFIVGTHAAREQAARIEDRPGEQAGREAVRLARQIGLRLEALRQSESRRPFEEYLSEDQYLQTDCFEELAIRSPLSQGPVDPLIWAHFQIDDLGIVTLPSLGPERDSSVDSGEQVESLQVAILDELECASADHLSALRRSPPDPAPHVVESRAGVITVTPFSWHTASIKQQPALVAVREVATPSAVLTQGYVVLSESLNPLIAGSNFPASIRPGEARGNIQALVPISGDAWTVHVDPAAATAAARAEARSTRLRFHTSFAIGSLAAALAGCAVVLLVRRTERLARERAVFAAAAAHELRTPLTNLQLFGEMLASGAGDRTRAPEYARRMAEESQRLGRVVTNMLGFSRLERGGSLAHPAPGNLSEAVREAVGRIRPSVEEGGAKIDLKIAGDPIEASFDRDAVFQILQNLIDNAERYGRSSKDRTIRIELQPGDDGPSLSVTDRGPGIPGALRPLLFRPFGRNPGPDPAAGLGIGLAIVKGLSEAQGARVRHEEPRDGGARFSIRFRP